MSELPETVTKAWSNRKGPAVLTTVDKNGIPNTVYVTCISIFNNDTILIADNFFNKTRQNILAGSKGSFLFITDDEKAFQIKGNIEYHKKGKIFEDMKKWNPPQHPGHAAAVLRVEEVYTGAKKLL